MVWKKRGSAKTLTGVIEQNSGMSIDELINPRPIPPDSIAGLGDAAGRILAALEDGEYISVFGDYDADGVTSSAILYLLIKHLGQTPNIRLPKRHTEGYGLSMKAVEECDEGLVITIDNGISAIGPVAAFQEKGVSVVVIDHHIPGDELPNAEVIVDPHIDPEKSDRESFRHYCGAGLALKLAELMLGYSTRVFDILTNTPGALEKALNNRALAERVCTDPYVTDSLSCTSADLQAARKTKGRLAELVKSNPAVLERVAGYEETLYVALAGAEKKQALENQDLLRNCSALAAIGTVADVVPLVGDNRRIVKEGLAVLNVSGGDKMQEKGDIKMQVYGAKR